MAIGTPAKGRGSLGEIASASASAPSASTKHKATPGGFWRGVNPRVSIQQGDSMRTMVARPAEGSERAHLWRRVVQQFPVCAGYQRQTSREIPVVILQLATPRMDSAQA